MGDMINPRLGYYKGDAGKRGKLRIEGTLNRLERCL